MITVVAVSNSNLGWSMYAWRCGADVHFAFSGVTKVQTFSSEEEFRKVYPDAPPFSDDGKIDWWVGD